jgi:glucose-1-phosphatase
MQQIKNIIFDLGGVLLNIDFSLSQQAFARLGVPNFADYISLTNINHLFRQLETGLEEDLFYEEFRTLSGQPLTNSEIRDAWNALLIQYRPKSIAVLPALKKKYKTFLLSNTNEIHTKAFEQMFRNEFAQQSLDSQFHEVFYSQRIGHRKPNAAAYEFVLKRHELNPGETLFIDDSFANIEAANALGIQTVHLLPGMTIEALKL